MMSKLILTLFAIVLVIPSACTRPITTTQSRAPEAYISDSGSVGFDIKPVVGENGSLRFLATYESQAFEFGPTHTAQGVEAGRGRFVAEPGSDASVLLSDLQKALGAKAIPSKVQRIATLPFMFVNIGDNLSQAPGGGFKVDPSGHWTAIKLFIGEGEQEGQVFLNTNTATGKGQFSIKDAEYGDIVLKYLAAVL